jgi:hypothetical protein
MKHSRPALAALAGTVLATALAATPAQAYKSSSTPQPGYETSKLAMTVKGKPRQGAIVTLEVTGFNQLFPVPIDPDFPDRTPLDFTLDVYVQPRSLYSTCGTDIDAQNDRVINFPTKVKAIAGNLNEGPSGSFRHTIKYRAGSARKIMFCAYTRYSATDDIIRSSLKHDLRKKLAR